MCVLNVHERLIAAPPAAVGALIDTLASDGDRLWPRSMWPAMRFDRALGVGATGGHRPIGYVVEEFQPGRLARFRFLRPRGFDGHHWFEAVPAADGSTVLRHTIAMSVRGTALVAWPLAIRWLHDALLEDALAQAQASLGLAPEVRPWSLWVRLLRWAMSGGRAPAQRAPLAGPAARLPAGEA